jgi:site-specific DNA-methyltransferase (adenine-specific)
MNMQTNKIYNMDCIEGMKQLEDNSVDSIVTDPPYELGFMGKSWDASGIAYNVEMWKEAFRVLKPGGYLLSFGGTRTYHRMACAIEDAGFEIRDQIQWVYGSGFPKSLNVEKQLEKQGNARASEFKGIGTAIKPANEPIVVARKPLAEKTVAENVLKYGTGGINIDDCRVGFINDEDEFESKNKNQHSKYPNSVMRNSAKNGIYHQDKREPEDYTAQGRFPANVIHDGSDEVLELFPDTNPSKTNLVSNKGSIWGSTNTDKEIRGHNDLGGSAARFFYCAKASKSERNAGLDGFEDKQYSYDGRNKEIENPYQRNKSIAKNNHPTVKPLKLMEYLVKLVTPKGGVCLDPFMGSGTTAVACKKNGFNYLGFDMTKEYVEIAEARIKATECQKKLLEE